MPQCSARIVNSDGKTVRFITLPEARRFIADGLAVSVDGENLTAGLRLSPLAKDKMRGQELALFEAGILKRKAFVQGGLCRTETKPFDRFKNK